MMVFVSGTALLTVFVLLNLTLCVESRFLGIHPEKGPSNERDDADKEQDVDTINLSTCGQATAAGGRVIGGEDATAGEWPWQAKLEIKGSGFTCGGSLITPTWVMTAAHCVSDNNPNMYSVTLGDLNREKLDGTEQEFSVKRVVVHPKYESPVPLNNDIALLELTRPASKTSFVNTVCLPSEAEVVATGTKCYISGWGMMDHPGSAAIQLQQAAMPVVSNQVCQTMHMQKTDDPSMAVTSVMLCAGDAGKTITSGCFGDSGGPFVCQNSAGRWIQQGIVSWGDPTCSSAVHFTVFTRVSMFREWIEKVLNE